MIYNNDYKYTYLASLCGVLSGGSDCVPDSVDVLMYMLLPTRIFVLVSAVGNRAMMYAVQLFSALFILSITYLAL